MNLKSTEPEAPDFDELVEIVRLSVRRIRGMDEESPNTTARVREFLLRNSAWLLVSDVSEPILAKAKQIVHDKLYS